MTWGTSRTWRYLGSKKVQDETNRIGIPESVYDYGILRPPEDIVDGDLDDDESEASRIGRAHWSFDTATAWVILSDRPLTEADDIQEGELVDGEVETVRYKPKSQTSYVQSGPDGSEWLTIPKNFFADSEGGNTVASQKYPEAVHFKNGEERHFVTAEEFLGDEPTPAKSCYVLKRRQLETILQHDGNWEVDVPNEADIPKFF